MPIEIPVIKEVIIARLSADDEVLSQVFSISENLAGDIRREMKWFPKYAKGLQNGGINVDIETFREYFTYRNSHQWKKEWAEIKKRKGKNKNARI
ncbi:hypothetical protein ACL43R_08395 [Lactococcus formosensis]|uniref:hypothetical protein n=1 Tax=Lactococcus formosensis TaxID=1281486 RepID=UPI0039F68EA5